MKNVYLFLSLGASFLLNAQVGTTCENPIVITSLPYATTGNTANYANNYNPPTSVDNCMVQGVSGNFYHKGNDVVYSFTPNVSGTVKIELPNAVAWTGVFVYKACADIGVNAMVCKGNDGSGAKTITINDLALTAGQPYYVLISSFADPQTIPYTLNVTQVSTTLAVNDVSKNKKQVGVYPNPAGDDLNFKSENNIISATIYTMEGKKIDNPIIKKNSIAIDRLSTGSYIVEFTDKLGNTFTKIFIKK